MDARDYDAFEPTNGIIALGVIFGGGIAAVLIGIGVLIGTLV